jgi:hypothetical protein
MLRAAEVESCCDCEIALIENVAHGERRGGIHPVEAVDKCGVAANLISEEAEVVIGQGESGRIKQASNLVGNALVEEEVSSGRPTKVLAESIEARDKLLECQNLQFNIAGLLQQHPKEVRIRSRIGTVREANLLLRELPHNRQTLLQQVYLELLAHELILNNLVLENLILDVEDTSEVVDTEEVIKVVQRGETTEIVECESIAAVNLTGSKVVEANRAEVVDAVDPAKLVDWDSTRELVDTNDTDIGLALHCNRCKRQIMLQD